MLYIAGMSRKTHKDNIFAHKRDIKPFAFDDEVARVFDDMIGRSVPAYDSVQQQIAKLLQKLAPQFKKLVDLGCSTGTLMFYLDEVLQSQSNYIGIDNSQSMIDKANERLSELKLSGTMNFICADIQTSDIQSADVVILNYVLQFLDLDAREALLTRIHSQMQPGSILILSEKTQNTTPQLANAFVAIHENFKQGNSYSRLEIAQKRKALENVLVPLSFTENLDMIRNSGFSTVDCFFCWFNFASFVAIK